MDEVRFEEVGIVVHMRKSGPGRDQQRAGVPSPE
jgi:hypothetical protein